MNIPALQAYAKASGVRPSLPARTAQTNALDTPKATPEMSRQARIERRMPDQPGQIITPAERDFFIKMYPENAQQIARYTVFNRNGSLEQSAVPKGSLIDGRV
jgi:hypothetical protein